MQAQPKIQMYDLEPFIEGHKSYFSENLQRNWTQFLLNEVKITLQALE